MMCTSQKCTPTGVALTQNSELAGFRRATWPKIRPLNKEFLLKYA